MVIKKLKILGTTYSIVEKSEKEDTRLTERGGYTDVSVKEIVVAIVEADEDSIKDLSQYRAQVLRHEIIHAFLFESGLWWSSHGVSSWGTDEEITDWIALQFPKLLKCFQEAGCI